MGPPEQTLWNRRTCRHHREGGRVVPGRRRHYPAPQRDPRPETLNPNFPSPATRGAAVELRAQRSPAPTLVRVAPAYGPGSPPLVGPVLIFCSASEDVGRPPGCVDESLLGAQAWHQAPCRPCGCTPRRALRTPGSPPRELAVPGQLTSPRSVGAPLRLPRA